MHPRRDYPRSHAVSDPDLFESADVLAAGVLHALIGVVDPPHPDSLGKHHLQRRESQSRVDSPRKRPTDAVAGVVIPDGGKAGEGGGKPDVGDVRNQSPIEPVERPS